MHKLNLSILILTALGAIIFITAIVFYKINTNNLQNQTDFSLAIALPLAFIIAFFVVALVLKTDNKTSNNLNDINDNKHNTPSTFPDAINIEKRALNAVFINDVIEKFTLIEFTMFLQFSEAIKQLPLPKDFTPENIVRVVEYEKKGNKFSIVLTLFSETPILNQVLKLNSSNNAISNTGKKTAVSIYSNPLIVLNSNNVGLQALFEVLGNRFRVPNKKLFSLKLDFNYNLDILPTIYDFSPIAHSVRRNAATENNEDNSIIDVEFYFKTESVDNFVLLNATNSARAKSENGNDIHTEVAAVSNLIQVMPESYQSLEIAFESPLSPFVNVYEEFSRTLFANNDIVIPPSRFDFIPIAESVFFVKNILTVTFSPNILSDFYPILKLPNSCVDVFGGSTILQVPGHKVITLDTNLFATLTPLSQICAIDEIFEYDLTFSNPIIAGFTNGLPPISAFTSNSSATYTVRALKGTKYFRVTCRPVLSSLDFKTTFTLTLSDGLHIKCPLTTTSVPIAVSRSPGNRFSSGLLWSSNFSSFATVENTGEEKNLLYYTKQTLVQNFIFTSIVMGTDQTTPSTQGKLVWGSSDKTLGNAPYDSQIKELRDNNSDIMMVISGNEDSDGINGTYPAKYFTDVSELVNVYLNIIIFYNCTYLAFDIRLQDNDPIANSRRNTALSTLQEILKTLERTCAFVFILPASSSSGIFPPHKVITKQLMDLNVKFNVLLRSMNYNNIIQSQSSAARMSLNLFLDYWFTLKTETNWMKSFSWERLYNLSGLMLLIGRQTSGVEADTFPKDLVDLVQFSAEKETPVGQIGIISADKDSLGTSGTDTSFPPLEYGKSFGFFSKKNTTVKLFDNGKPGKQLMKPLLKSKTRSTISISWEYAANATSYNVLRNGYVISALVEGVKFTDTGLTTLTEYIYSIQSNNEFKQFSAAGNSLVVSTD